MWIMGKLASQPTWVNVPDKISLATPGVSVASCIAVSSLLPLHLQVINSHCRGSDLGVSFFQHQCSRLHVSNCSEFSKLLLCHRWSKGNLVGDTNDGSWVYSSFPIWGRMLLLWSVSAPNFSLDSCQLNCILAMCLQEKNPGWGRQAPKFRHSGQPWCLEVPWMFLWAFDFRDSFFFVNSWDLRIRHQMIIFPFGKRQDFSPMDERIPVQNVCEIE